MMLIRTVQMSQNHLSSNHGNFSEKRYLALNHIAIKFRNYYFKKFYRVGERDFSNERSFVRRLRTGVLTVPIQFHVWTTFTEILKTLLYIGSFSTVFDLAGHGLLCNYFCLFLSPPRQFFFCRFSDREPRVWALSAHLAEPNRFRRYFAPKL